MVPSIQGDTYIDMGSNNGGSCATSTTSMTSTASITTITSMSNGDQCPITKQGNPNGEATMFQENWVHEKTGACGFAKPTTTHAEGFFTAVGTADWDEGFSCGTCVELEYQGNTITVNVVDRCGACSK